MIAILNGPFTGKRDANNIIVNLNSTRMTIKRDASLSVDPLQLNRVVKYDMVSK